MEIYYSKSLAKVYWQRVTRANVLNEIWFQEYKNNQKIKSNTQWLKDSELKW